MDVVWLRILDGRSDQSDQGHQDQQSTDQRWKDCLKCPPPGHCPSPSPPVPLASPPKEFVVCRILHERNYLVKGRGLDMDGATVCPDLEHHRAISRTLCSNS